MKPLKNFAEDRPGDQAVVSDLAQRQHIEYGRGRDRAEHEQPAHPYRKSEHASVPQREHPPHYNHEILMPFPVGPASGVRWQTWSGAAFARARDEQKPILLSIATTWCHWCAEMDRTSYADPEIAALIHDRFVPVRVDAEDRPDVSERYSLGGWPTTAFLTPAGDILAGGTFVPLDRMRAVLMQVAEAFHVQPARAAAPVADASGTRDDSMVSDAELTSRVFATFDAEFGGFGTEPKFPHTAALHLALDVFSETGDASFERIVVESLDHIGWGGLYDPVDGGFFRYATTRDWQLPHVEKLLDVNAALARIFLQAGTKLQLARFTERGADTLRYIQNSLADPVDGGWHSSQRADDPYYAEASSDARRALRPPAVSPSLYADSNAVMVSTALFAAGVFNDDGLREFAVRSLERVLLANYKPGEGVAHYNDGQPRVRGLLGDQFAMAAACLDAFEITGNVVYEMMAEELGHYALRTMWDDAAGGFFDRSNAGGEETLGLMHQPVKPFVINCDAARTMWRLGRASGDQEFGRAAERTLAAMRPSAADQGPLAAHWLLAVRAATPR